MELAGVAADIVDASSRTSRCLPSALTPTATTTSTTARRSATLNNNAAAALPQAPLELFGCVGEGAPAESMAREALVLWVGVFRLPPQSRALLQGPQDSAQRDKGPEGKTQGDAGAGGGRDKGLGDKGVGGGRHIEEGEGVVARRSRLQALDKPVMKAILCASDAIRQRVAQSLLQACGVGPAAAEAAAAAAAATASAVVGNEVAVPACLEKTAPGGNDNVSARSSTSSLTVASSGFVESDALEKESDCALTQLSRESDHAAAAAASVGCSSPASFSAAGVCAFDGLEKAAADGEGKVPETAALSSQKGVPEEQAVCGAVGQAGGARVRGGGGVSVRDELREHVVRLLLDNMPRMAKPSREIGVGEGARGVGLIHGSTERRRDCTQLFQVLCALVEELIEVGRRGGGDGGGGGSRRVANSFF